MLEELGIELIGASYKAIQCAEDREIFAETMASVGLGVPAQRDRDVGGGGAAALASGALQLPVVIRPGIHPRRPWRRLCPTPEELDDAVTRGVRESPISQVLLERSVAGWGEFELEVIRDKNDNVVIICSIENIDPMGVHTGDSATVAPAQTLTDREYQTLRDASATVIRAVGVETGGSNVQFALNRDTGELVVIEMNPRVSRSSALASKATGYPIAKVATKLAVGYTLDEIPNDITRDHAGGVRAHARLRGGQAAPLRLRKVSRRRQHLTTQMKSVGEAMGIGRTFAEAWGKAMRSRELDQKPRREGPVDVGEWDRFDRIQGRLLAGESAEALAVESSVHRWFVDEWSVVADAERELTGTALSDISPARWLALKRLGLADARIAELVGRREPDVRDARIARGCAAGVQGRRLVRRRGRGQGPVLLLDL